MGFLNVVAFMPEVYDKYKWSGSGSELQGILPVSLRTILCPRAPEEKGSCTITLIVMPVFS
jgi:hypothetical protein